MSGVVAVLLLLLLRCCAAAVAALLLRVVAGAWLLCCCAAAAVMRVPMIKKRVYARWTADVKRPTKNRKAAWMPIMLRTKTKPGQEGERVACQQ